MLVRHTSPAPTIARIGTTLLGMEVKQQPMTSTSKRKSKTQKRFNDEQIKLLESMFETESRPELLMKQQLASELGLQPRQVAIWFQNKRARSKSKQIEQEYSMLKINYDNLASNVETLKKENQSLLTQLQRLRNLTKRDPGNKATCLGLTEDGSKYVNPDKMLETKENPNFLLETRDSELQMTLPDDNHTSVSYFRDECTALNMAGLARDSSASTEKECSFDSSNLLHYSSGGGIQWWEFQF